LGYKATQVRRFITLASWRTAGVQTAGKNRQGWCGRKALSLGLVYFYQSALRAAP